MFRGEAAYDHLPARADLEQPLLEKASERLPNRGAGAAESLREIALGQHAAGRKVTARDALANVVIGAVAQSPAA
jgi:hypothetical protein